MRFSSFVINLVLLVNLVIYGTEITKIMIGKYIYSPIPTLVDKAIIFILCFVLLLSEWTINTIKIKRRP